MAWLDCFFPQYRVKSAAAIPYQKLWQDGYRGVIFDIDNTLVEHGAAADEQARQLFDELRSIGLQTMILSNNRRERVASFALDVSSGYIAKADKPKVKGYDEAMAVMATTKETTFFVGDQLLTDIWGANRAGIRSYLVEPIGKEVEIQIILKRWLEKVLWRFHRDDRRTDDG
ncbi:MAG: YqeG family HAD IIIA-type phosphatase [Lachnospiraceae bacterium]|jgi:HAD superfamily phosphatase (TIGR01668 family)|nr:YqeG family HAD IIIA-type phosphatase [Lachnospiraceae bacterium]